jgi:hypothetical protein
LRARALARQLGEGEVPCEAVFHAVEDAPQRGAREPARTFLFVRGGAPAQRGVAPEEVRGERPRQGLGVERAGQAAALELGEQGQPDLLDERVACLELPQQLDPVGVQPRPCGRRADERGVEVEVEPVGLLLAPEPPAGHPRRDEGHVAPGDVALAQPPADALPHLDRAAEVDDDGVAEKGGTSISPVVCLKRIARRPRHPLPSLEETVSTGATWEKSSAAARSPSLVVTRSPPRRRGTHASYSTFGWASRRRGLPIRRY